MITIALADDDDDDQSLFREALNQIQKTGTILRSFYSGTQLLNFLFKKGEFVSSAEPSPDLIILDLNMPMLDGLSVLRKLKSTSLFRDIPVFVLTTSKNEVQQEQCMDQGCAGYYVKPVKFSDLEGIVREILSWFNLRSK